jgi:hypothetical protein
MEKSPLVKIVSYPDNEPVTCPGLDCSDPLLATWPSKRHDVTEAETRPNRQGVIPGLFVMLFFYNERVVGVLFCHELSFLRVRHAWHP